MLKTIQLSNELFNLPKDSNIFFQGFVENADNINGFGKLYTDIFTYVGHFKDNKFHGQGEIIFKNNNIEQSFKGTFINGLKNGIGLEIYSNGDYYEGSFLENKKHGNGSIYNKNKQIKIKSSWNNDIIDENYLIKIYYDNGNLKYDGNLNKDNEYHDIGKLYYDNLNNDICFDGKFNNNNIDEGDLYLKNELKIFSGKFYKNFFLKGQYIIENNLFFDGEFQINKLNKRVVSINIDHETIKNIKYSFKKGFFYLKGNKKIYKQFNKKNHLQGEYKEYYNDILVEKSYYKNNKKNGLSIKYKNGKIILKANYKRNLLFGNFEEYEFTQNNNYYLKFKAIYNKNKLISGTIYYNNNFIKYNGFFKNKYYLTGKLYYNNPSNSIKYEGEFRLNKYDGKGKSYFQNELLEYEGDFLNGCRSGEGSSYHISTGNMEYNGIWLNNEKHGMGSLYNEAGEFIYHGKWVYNNITT